jgi:hypothetical protein
LLSNGLKISANDEEIKPLAELLLYGCDMGVNLVEFSVKATFYCDLNIF